MLVTFKSSLAVLVMVSTLEVLTTMSYINLHLTFDISSKSICNFFAQS